MLTLDSLYDATYAVEFFYFYVEFSIRNKSLIRALYCESGVSNNFACIFLHLIGSEINYQKISCLCLKSLELSKLWPKISYNLVNFDKEKCCVVQKVSYRFEQTIWAIYVPLRRSLTQRSERRKNKYKSIRNVSFWIFEVRIWWWLVKVSNRF